MGIHPLGVVFPFFIFYKGVQRMSTHVTFSDREMCYIHDLIADYGDDVSGKIVINSLPAKNYDDFIHKIESNFHRKHGDEITCESEETSSFLIEIGVFDTLEKLFFNHAVAYSTDLKKQGSSLP